MTPRYTHQDRTRFRLPYVRAADMGEGYLAERFKQYAALQRSNAEKAAKAHGRKR